MRINKKMHGVTLIEILLVLVIISFIMVMLIGFMQQKTDELRRNRTSLQMQEILNAGLAYYVLNSAWPTNLQQLQTANLLPPGAFNSPYGNQYQVYGGQSGASMFYVSASVLTPANAQLIAGRLPLAFVADQAGTLNTPPTQGSCTSPTSSPTSPCTYVVSSVNVPGQNLNNANAVTFSNLYHNGGCVPVPSCPVDKNGNTMTPQIIVVPVAVTGVNDPPTCNGSYNPADCSNVNVYPITNFTAYATQGSPGTNTAPSCGSTGGPSACYTDMSTQNSLPSIPGGYWRVCLEIETVKGRVTPNSPDWGNLSGSIMAITRCQPNNEGATTSQFNVWMPN